MSTNEGGIVCEDCENYDCGVHGVDNEPTTIPCCICGKPTTWDPVYNDLCYRCIRADNE